MKPTNPQQLVLDSIFANLNQNYVVFGVPGAGKTALLTMISQRLKAVGVEDILALTFSHDLAESMTERIADATVSTTHAYMFTALRHFLKVKNIKAQITKDYEGKWRPSYVDDKLLQRTVFRYLQESYGLLDAKKIPADLAKEFYGFQFDIMHCVEKIRTQAWNYETQAQLIHTELDLKCGVEVVDDALKILKVLSDRFFLRGTCDFGGMLYLPLVHEELRTAIRSPKWLIVDEANDTTPALYECYKIIGRESNVIVVGDQKQTIHIWAGAPSNCMDILQEYYKAQRLSYDFTFRVPKAMCKYLQQSGIDTRIQPYEGNAQGKIEKITYNKFLSKVFHGDMVLCRYNRGNKVNHTLQKISIDLIKMRKKVAFHGSTHIEDIQELFALAQPLPADFKAIKAHVENSVMNTIAEEYTAKELTQDNYRCKMLREKLESFNLYFDFYKSTLLLKGSVKEFIHFLEKMYDKSSNAIQLISVHRSKGLEGKRVWIFHIEAMVADVQNQDADRNVRIEAHNLLLVALTRSLDETYLVECDLPTYLPEP